MSDDTETLLALLSSLLIAPITDQSVLLNALVEYNGDVKSAAQKLNSSKKRKRTSGLDDWVSVSKKPASKGKEIKAETADSASKTPSKPVVDLMSVLRPPPPTVRSVLRLPPLTLSTPELVAKHTPCTLHRSILPPELACRLFYTLLASETWRTNQWWLFDRVVESPHKTSFFARKSNGVDGNESWQQAAQYWYNGRRTDPPPIFPLVMEEACQVVERVVNEEIHKRKRFPLEWGGTAEDGQLWHANVAASNLYEGGKESVGFHSDQLQYLGPYPTIASLSLGTTRVFRLREVVPTDGLSTRKAQTFNIPLPHNSLTIMHASCQERFKHSIPPQPTIDLFRSAYPPPQSIDDNSESASASTAAQKDPSICRINITFRFYRPDFAAPTTPRCACGVPAILRPDMKNRQDGHDRYWWTCYAGVQQDGKGCKFWRELNMRAEGRCAVEQ